ncbi:hypothetical protein HY486_02385 [Candidatus Woesearchaeota archaeon]|nr:hypothetical protein [Candidatus Woesearchaeota archaeon]
MISKEQTFILFVVGSCQDALAQKFANKPVSVRLSKQSFIQLAMNSGIAQKKERALYKNLQDLEERKLVSYDCKHLCLTPRGARQYSSIARKLKPYISASKIIEVNVLSYMTKAYTMLKP